ncbi:MAG: hypothetical protein GHCLOJNM_00643 [bacterium]|nr:hypothetical protein [bacterium]
MEDTGFSWYTLVEGEDLAQGTCFHFVQSRFHPAFHMIAVCKLERFTSEVKIVDFRRTFSLPIGFMRELARGVGPRVRLLPPYREHPAQAFARFFLRVGLPVDIPPFKK